MRLLREFHRKNKTDRERERKSDRDGKNWRKNTVYHTFNFQPKVHIDWRDFRITISSTMLTFYFDIYVVCWISIIRPNLYRFHDIKRTYIQIKKNVCTPHVAIIQNDMSIARSFMCIGGCLVLVLEFLDLVTSVIQIRIACIAHVFVVFFPRNFSSFYALCLSICQILADGSYFSPISLSICCCLLWFHIIEWFEVYLFSITSRLLHVRF